MNTELSKLISFIEEVQPLDRYPSKSLQTVGVLVDETFTSLSSFGKGGAESLKGIAKKFQQRYNLSDEQMVYTVGLGGNLCMHPEIIKNFGRFKQPTKKEEYNEMSLIVLKSFQ